MMHEYGAPAITPWRGSLRERIQQAIDYADFLHAQRDDGRPWTRVMLAVWGTEGPLIGVKSGDEVEDVLSSISRLMSWPDESNTVKANIRVNTDDLEMSLNDAYKNIKSLAKN